MEDGKLTRKIRKKLGLQKPQSSRLKKSKPAKIQVQQPSGKGCCGRSK